MTEPKKPARSWNWVLWWRVGAEELEEQVSQYDGLSVWKSARKLSALLLGLSMLVTAALTYFGITDSSAYFDVVLFGILAAFVYFGHRWAMIVAMVLWTYEKAATAVEGVGTIHPNGGSLITQFIWWTAYMHAFYLAFRTEQRRRGLSSAPSTPAAQP